MIWSYEYFVQMSISARRSLEIELRRFLPTCQNSEDLFSPKLCCSAMADDEVATLCSQFQAGNWVVLWCSYLKPNPKPLARACSIARMLSAQNWMKKIRLGLLKRGWSAIEIPLGMFTQSNVQLLSLSGGSVEAPPEVNEDPGRQLVSQSFQRFKSGGLPRFVRQGANKFKSWSRASVSVLVSEPQSAATVSATTEPLQKSRTEQGRGIPGAAPSSSIISAGRRGCSGPVVCCIGNALAKDTFVIVWLILVGCRCFCKDDLFNKPNPINLFTFCV